VAFRRLRRCSTAPLTPTLAPRKRGAREMFVRGGEKSFIAERSRTSLGRTISRHVAAGRSDVASAAVIAVVVPHPVGQIVVGTSLIAAPGHQIENVVGAEHEIAASSIG